MEGPPPPPEAALRLLLPAGPRWPPQLLFTDSKPIHSAASHAVADLTLRTSSSPLVLLSHGEGFAYFYSGRCRSHRGPRFLSSLSIYPLESPVVDMENEQN
ncbi:hypothetical protein OPV22_029994 [Ensete ventricosum]|uniref:Uncharacterized protein n=1 Tax=Ensete ventricosum TaxID=4639 RepID=A0AAV8P7X9_ENSVE|nr:hypothetical protein OPV22_029994 [Ensete ventricosum]